ncbi:MAG: gas vesicle protein K [Desulfobacteraceae bacterium]|nr:gas vesicle protein K [Desulfobacteraceae bacterium]
MNIENSKIASDAAADFLGAMEENYAKDPRCFAKEQTEKKNRLDLDPDDVKNGLGQLVLTLVELIHELLEKQAIRRIDSGSLNDDEIERLGLTFMRQAEEIERLRKEFGLEEDDLNLDLGPLGKLL